MGVMLRDGKTVDYNSDCKDRVWGIFREVREEVSECRGGDIHGGKMSGGKHGQREMCQRVKCHKGNCPWGKYGRPLKRSVRCVLPITSESKQHENYS